jgi:hypothetical protein
MSIVRSPVSWSSFSSKSSPFNPIMGIGSDLICPRILSFSLYSGNIKFPIAPKLIITLVN